MELAGNASHDGEEDTSPDIVIVITQLVEPWIHIADMKQEVPTLTGLRSVTALWALAFHSLVLTNALRGSGYDVLGILAGAGHLGVDLISVLSGFVIALN